MSFGKTFLNEIQELFVQILLLAQAAGVLKLGNISLDGSKVHADASTSSRCSYGKSKAVSYKRLIEIESQLRKEVGELFALGEQVDQGDMQMPEGLDVQDEIAIREERLANLAKAKAVLEARAKERYEAEQAEYEAKLRERERKARKHRHKPKGRPPQPPKPGPRDKDQYNFTDPDSRIMKNSTNEGFDQHYNVQVAAGQESLLIVAHALSNHPNDKQEAVPTLDAIAPELGKPEAAALDNGYFSEPNIHAFQERKVEAYIATGREPHHKDWHTVFAELPEPPGDEASPKEQPVLPAPVPQAQVSVAEGMAYKLQTKVGEAIYRLRKCTVEPVIGIIKEILGFPQFSLRGLWAAAGEWPSRPGGLPARTGCLVCLAFRLRRQTLAHLVPRPGADLARPKPARKWRVALETCSFTPVLL